MFISSDNKKKKLFLEKIINYLCKLSIYKNYQFKKEILD